MTAGAEDIMEIVRKVHTLMATKRANGEDISRAEQLDRQSKKAAKGRNMDEAERLLKEALAVLEGSAARPTKASHQRVKEEERPLSAYARVNVSVDQNINSFFGIDGPSIIDRPAPADGRQMGGNFDAIENLASVGAGWVRYGRYFGWDLIEKEKGIYDWSKTDFVMGNTYKSGVNILAIINPVSKLYGVNPKTAPTDMEPYLKFLRAAVERYNGYTPGTPRIDYWQICNEVDNAIYWKETPETYARLLVESYRVIKKANPVAKVVLGALATPAGLTYHKEIIKALPANERAFDVFDFHWFSSGDDGYRMHYEDRVAFGDFVAGVKSVLAENGYGDVPLWMAEAGDYSGLPDGGPRVKLNRRTEQEQAASLVKIYVHSIANGVKKIFWVSLTEWYGFGGIKNGYFDRVGLIHNAKHNDGSGKKAAYFAYRAMSNIFHDARYDRAIKDKKGSHIYRFSKNGRPLWALWNESMMTSASLELPPGASSVKLIDALNGNVIVEISAVGQDVTSGRLRRTNKVIDVDFGKAPVYVVTE